MEGALGKSGEVVKEEKRVESSGDEDGYKENNFLKEDIKLESAEADREMGEVRQENQRLRMHLNQIMKDYQTLQMQFDNILKQEAKESANRAALTDLLDQATDEPELVSLSLGRSTSSEPRKDQNSERLKVDDQQENEGGLALRLDSSSFEMPKTGPSTENSSKSSPENSLEANKEAGESWPPHKVLKTRRREDDEVLEQNPAKKARVSVRVRCDTPTMNDGCQWRKYGQKIAKGNPCPRAYYRCTVAPTCPVRKQVQRCAEDMGILITTYEGTHNHPLPISATAMASTTSAAASMLLSGSSTSGTGPSGTIASSSADLQGLNFYLSDNSNTRQYYLPNSSMSSAPSHPTITLDLTSHSSSSTSSSSHFSKIPSNFLSAPRYSSTNLNFSSLESNPLPISWTNNGVLNYGTQMQYNKNHVGGNSLNFGSIQNQENMFHSFMQNLVPNSSPPRQILPTDSIAAATKAITSDPSFQSALATALTSIIGSNVGGGRNLGLQTGGENYGKSSNFGEAFPSPNTNGNKCSSSYLTLTPPSAPNSLPASLTFLQPLQPPTANKFST
ncbi:hypothetical protein RHSIM_Rhsim08G0158800 [Rhododendron simsii]|uniref:WRKY domain-containing protein n=1 Tax=Rhododendron simsii TaxID=118357 RepID=A0A834LG15_RHOSS|nr:hypothetical protein RHSIM_Rhsim08G0158800 [Rhododendron simsii]